MADDIAGIVLEIPSGVLDNIEKADKAIKRLQATSETAAQKIKGHFDTTAVSGLNAFIRKVQEAQVELKGLSLPSGKGMDMGKIGSDAAKSASDINLLVQSLSQLTSALSKNKAVRTATKNVAPQETEYSKVTAELAKQTERYVQLSQAIAAYNQKKFEETTFSERTQNAANVAELQTLQQSIPLLRDKVALMERAKQAGVEAVNPNLETRRANAELAAMNKAYAEEEKASAKKAAQIEKDRQREAEAAKKSYEQQQKMYEKLFGKGGVADQQVLQSLANQKAKTLATAQGAMDYAKNARSLKEMTEAYRNLKTVMDKIDPKNPQWQQMNKVYLQTKQRIDEIRKAMGDFSSQSKQMAGIAGQLRNQLTAAFSVAAIKEYMSQMIRVRAEFELQNTALRAILQNKDEADRIFAQVQQMALQSPFTIMQLTTYTKQLAAYRIEANKLVGTTKMLADVSAGLGVDIQRLILAYGQVKSANYLRACLGRGTEIKTMRGIVKVEEIVVGDKLYNDHNEVTTVAELYSGTQQMYKFTELAPDGYSYRVNEAHILTMYDKLTNAVVDVKVLDYLQYPERYMGVRMSEGEICTYAVKCQKDIVDEYFGFKLDGNKRFQLVDGTITHNTEVRQFTEAGLNIAGELAQYFSELQGKMISVGDVMDMITKRMVRFEDVEEVFKRVTSAGGLFYDMQKKQSETLWGQLQRIQDAYSIMMNDIGKSNQGAISTMLTTIRALISNWRTVATVMKLVVGVGGGLLLVLKSINIQAKQKAAEKWIKSIWTGLQQAITAAGGLKAALMSLNFTGWGAIVAGVGLAVAAIHELMSSTSALREELDRVLGESMTDMYDAMYQFKDLAKTATDATKPFKERNEAMEALHRTFKDILPSEKLEIENLRQMTDGYKEATTAIKEFYTEAAKKKAAETIANETEQAWSTLINHLKDGAEYLQRGQSELTNLPIGTIKGLIGKTMMELKTEIQNGTTDVNDAWKRFKALFKETSGIQLEDNFSTRSFRSFFGEFTFTIADMYDDITDIVKRGNESQSEFDAQFREGFSKETQALIEEYDKRKQAVAEFNNALMNYAQLQQKGQLFDDKGSLTENGKSVTADLNAATWALNNYLDLLGESRISWQGLYASTKNNTDAMLFFNEVQQRVLGGFIQYAQRTSADTSVQAWAQKAERDLRSAGLGELQLEIVNLAKESAKTNGIQLSMLDKLRVSAETNYNSAAEDAHKLSKAAAENIAKITATKIQLMQLGMTAEQAQRQAEFMHGNGSTEAELKKQEQFWDRLSKLYGFSENKNTPKGKDPWQNRVSLIKEMNTEYEKLLKYYNESEAKLRIQKSYAEAVSEAFKGIKLNGKDLGDIEIWKGFDKQGMIEQLRAILDSGLTISKEKRAELQKMLAGFNAEIEINVRKDEIQKAKDDIQKAFDNYELTKTISNLGINVDLTYIVGGKPVTLPQLRNELEKSLSEVKFKGGNEELVKYYEDQLRKVTDLEKKAQIERLKNYNKYLIESVGERAQIELKAAQDINKIRSDETLNDFSKEQAVMQRRKKMYEELTKFDFDQFKGGDVYLSVFKDLEAASKEQLTYVISKLKEMQSTFKDLSPVQVKSIANEIKKMEEALAGKDSVKNLFTNLRESVKYARKRNNLLKEQTRIQQKVDRNQQELSDAERSLIQLTQQRDAIQDKLSDEWENANKKVEDQQGLVKQLQDRVKELEEQLQNITGTIDKGNSAWDGFRKGLGNVRSKIAEVKDSLDSVFTGLDSMGLVNDSFRDTYESITEILGGLDAVMGGLESIDIARPFTIITGTIKTLGGILQTIGAFFGIGDKKKERQIKRLTEKVDELNKAYAKLQKSMEEAYTFDDYNASYLRMQKTLEAEKMAYKEMIALEKAKKKTDKDKIKYYKEKLEELAEAEQELYEKRHEKYGSTNDPWDEANNWVDAWLDAYKETGDGLDALGNSWDEFYENLVKKQATSKVLGSRMDKFIKDINDAIDANMDEYGYVDAFKEIGERFKKEFGDMNQGLKDFFEYAGITSGGDLILSDLQKGIQNITEPQAAAIEAYLNSMRFAVFHHTEQLDTLITAIQAQYGGGDSPILVEVRAIRSILSNIDDRFRSITQSVTGRGLVLKVN